MKSWSQEIWSLEQFLAVVMQGSNITYTLTCKERLVESNQQTVMNLESDWLTYSLSIMLLMSSTLVF